jgi:hypothetical protein
LKGEPGVLFKKTLNAAHAGLAAELEEQLTARRPIIEQETYLMCISEHRSDEDQHGRLSMWRAYGGSAGIALVLNRAAIFSRSDVLGAYSSPVIYASPAQFAEQFRQVADGMKSELNYLSELPRETVRAAAFQMLRFAALCTKHPAFHEELEWRIIASPNLRPSNRLNSSIEVVHGTPQMVLKIDLRNDPEHGLLGLELPELLDRIIIGPCKFPLVVYRAFRQLLSDSGVPDPESRIIISDIPLREP